MNWFGFMWIWAIALFMAGIFLAIENDQGGSRRSVWTHRVLLIAGVLVGSIAVLTA